MYAEYLRPSHKSAFEYSYITLYVEKVDTLYNDPTVQWILYTESEVTCQIRLTQGAGCAGSLAIYLDRMVLIIFSNKELFINSDELFKSKHLYQNKKVYFGCWHKKAQNLLVLLYKNKHLLQLHLLIVAFNFSFNIYCQPDTNHARNQTCPENRDNTLYAVPNQLLLNDTSCATSIRNIMSMESDNSDRIFYDCNLLSRCEVVEVMCPLEQCQDVIDLIQCLQTDPVILTDCLDYGRETWMRNPWKKYTIYMHSVSFIYLPALFWLGF